MKNTSKRLYLTRGGQEQWDKSFRKWTEKHVTKKEHAVGRQMFSATQQSGRLGVKPEERQCRTPATGAVDSRKERTGSIWGDVCAWLTYGILHFFFNVYLMI